MPQGASVLFSPVLTVALASGLKDPLTVAPKPNCILQNALISTCLSQENMGDVTFQADTRIKHSPPFIRSVSFSVSPHITVSFTVLFRICLNYNSQHNYTMRAVCHELNHQSQVKSTWLILDLWPCFSPQVAINIKNADSTWSKACAYDASGLIKCPLVLSLEVSSGCSKTTSPCETKCKLVHTKHVLWST